MSVGLVAAVNATVERLVGRVYVRVFLAIRTVGEATITAAELTHERLLAYKHNTSHYTANYYYLDQIKTY